MATPDRKGMDMQNWDNPLVSEYLKEASAYRKFFEPLNAEVEDLFYKPDSDEKLVRYSSIELQLSHRLDSWKDGPAIQDFFDKNRNEIGETDELHTYKAMVISRDALRKEIKRLEEAGFTTESRDEESK